MCSLLAALDEAYNRKSWHGPNLRGSLRGLPVEKVVLRPGPGRHNIWELALHCAYWKYAVWRQLAAPPKPAFPLKGSNFWSREQADPAAWKQDLRLLDQMHRQLRDAVAHVAQNQWQTKPAGSKYTLEFLVRGAAAHDLYHAGQIQLIKRLIL